MFQNDVGGAEHDRCIHDEVPIFYVVQVVLKFFEGVDDASSVKEFYLRPAGESRLNDMS